MGREKSGAKDYEKAKKKKKEGGSREKEQEDPQEKGEWEEQHF